MKLYHINPNNWGEEYFVMSDSKENAFDAFIEFLKKNMEKEEEQNKDSYFEMSYDKDVYEDWLNHNVNELPRGYTIDEYEANQVVNSEIA